jgi:hypothetical protein
MIQELDAGAILAWDRRVDGVWNVDINEEKWRKRQHWPEKNENFLRKDYA